MTRLFKSKAFWLLFFSGIVTIGYWYISTWDKSVLGDRANYPYPWNINVVNNDIYELLLNKKTTIGISWGILFLIIQVIILYIPISIKRKKFIENTLRHILNQYLKGDISNNRITIFVTKNGYQIVLKYIWQCFIKNLGSHKEKKLINYYVKKFPNLFKKYLVFYSRIGKPYENGTSTFFLVPENENEIDGFAPYVFYHSRKEFVELPDISHIDLKTYAIGDLTNNPNDEILIDKYLKDGKINNFKSLKSFHRFPQHLFATPILDKLGIPYGVIVFDSQEKTQDFKANIDNLNGYCKLTENIINYIN